MFKSFISGFKKTRTWRIRVTPMIGWKMISFFFLRGYTHCTFMRSNHLNRFVTRTCFACAHTAFLATKAVPIPITLLLWRTIPNHGPWWAPACFTWLSSEALERNFSMTFKRRNSKKCVFKDISVFGISFVIYCRSPLPHSPTPIPTHSSPPPTPKVSQTKTTRRGK